MSFFNGMMVDMEHMYPGVVSEICKLLNDGFTVILAGIRGAGKTHLARAAAESWSRPSGTGPVMWLDLEDPRLLPGPSVETVQLFAKTRRNREPSLLILDEVKRVGNWEAMLTGLRNNHGIPILATMSVNVELLSRAELPPWIKIVPMRSSVSHLVVDRLNDKSVKRENKWELFKRGCLPRLIYSQELEAAAKDLLYDIWMRDVILESEVRDVSKLTDITVYLIESSGGPVSLSGLRKVGMGSIDKARSFVSLVEKTGLVTLVERLEDLGRGRKQASRLCFVADTGLLYALSRGPVSPRRLALTAVYLELVRLGVRLAAWKQGRALGLVVVGAAGPRLVVELALENESGEPRRRLTTLMRKLSCGQGLLLTEGDQQWDLKVPPGWLRVRNLWHWLAAPSLEAEPLPLDGTLAAADGPAMDETGSSPFDESKPEPDKGAPPAGLPPHLL